MRGNPPGACSEDRAESGDAGVTIFVAEAVDKNEQEHQLPEEGKTDRAMLARVA